MATVRPFRALQFTPAAGAIEELTCPPYDIISDEERRAFLERNSRNVIRLELPREGADFYATAGDTLRAWMADGIMACADTPAFYLYAMDFEALGTTHTVAGLIGEVQLSPFSEGVVLPHEYTLSKAKTDRLNLMRATACNFSNIYSLYQDGDNILNVMDFADTATALYAMTDEAGVHHRLWAITDTADCARIAAHFAEKTLYIADGHHRYETAVNYRNERREQGAPIGGDADYIMMMLVEMSHEGLVVFPTHRLIRGLDGFDRDAMLAACEPNFTVEAIPVDTMQARLDAAYAAGDKAFCLYTHGEAALLTLKSLSVMDALLPELSAASRQLDVTVLHSLILEHILRIDKENMAAQRNLTYTRSMEEALGSVDAGDSQCAFLLNPTRVEEIGAVAAAGEKMPQKSTYFYPKLITGLTMRYMGE